MSSINNTAILFEDESTVLPEGLDQRHLKRIHLMQQLFMATFPYAKPAVTAEPPENSSSDVAEESPNIDNTIDDSLDTDTNSTDATIKAIIANLETIDQAIQAAAPERPISGINRVDLAILRLIIFEAEHSKTPKKVLINEAVVLAKNFGSETSAKFVNGVLGTIMMIEPVPEPISESDTTEIA